MQLTLKTNKNNFMFPSQTIGDVCFTVIPRPRDQIKIAPKSDRLFEKIEEENYRQMETKGQKKKTNWRIPQQSIKMITIQFTQHTFLIWISQILKRPTITITFRQGETLR